MSTGEGLLTWTDSELAAVQSNLERVAHIVTTDWLSETVMGDDLERLDESSFDASCTHVVRDLLRVRAMDATGVCFFGFAGHDSERTRISSALSQWQLPHKSTEEAQCVVVQIYACFGAGEAAAAHSGRDFSALACRPFFRSLCGAKQLHAALTLWRGCWPRLFQGQVVGIACDGPSSWVEVLKGSEALATVCCWEFFSCSSFWVLLASPTVFPEGVVSRN